MILSNVAIAEALDDGRLIIEPEPKPRPGVGTERSPFGTTAVDLRLGATLQIPTPNLSMVVDLRHGDVRSTLAAISQRVEMTDQGFIKLDRNQLILGQTLERVSLPLPPDFEDTAPGKPALAARVEGKSSLARFGLLVHFTAPTIHAGWSGPITLEIMNLGPTPVQLFPGMSICQLILEEVRDAPLSNPSQFHGQSTPTGQ